MNSGIGESALKGARCDVFVRSAGGGADRFHRHRGRTTDPTDLVRDGDLHLLRFPRANRTKTPAGKCSFRPWMDRPRSEAGARSLRLLLPRLFPASPNPNLHGVNARLPRR